MTRLRRDRLDFQAYNLIAGLTAEENILLPARLAGRPAAPAWSPNWWPRWVCGIV